MPVKRRAGVISLVATLLALDPRYSVQAKEPAGRFTAVDVFKLKTVGDVRISPDGRTIAYEALDTDIMIDDQRRSVRLVDVATGVDRLWAKGASSPRWSPDSRWLVYADSKDGVERLMLSDRAGTATRMIAAMPRGPSAVTWSRDGRLLAFTRFVPEPSPSRVPTVRAPEGARWAPPLRVITTVRHDEDGQGPTTPGHRQLFVVAASGGPVRQVTTATLDVVGDAAWMPDGRSLVYAAVNLDTFGDGFRTPRLYRVAVVGGKPIQLTGKDLAAQSPSVSPDGRRVAFIAWDADGREFSPIRLRILNPGNDRSHIIEEALDRDFSTVAWSKDGRWLYAGYADRSIDKVRHIAIDGPASTDVAEGLAGDFTVSDDGIVAYAVARPDRPADVAVIGRGAAKPIVLTQRNDALLGSKALGQVVPLTATSTLDGAKVGAWLTRPAGYVAGRRYPLILDIHGGPHGYDGPTWRTRDQLYAAAGYAVLHVNYRGSTSYGFAFVDRIAADPLAPPTADLMSAVDAAIAEGVADPKELFVTGGSAGGELTAWIIGHTNRFQAAMAEKPVINRVSQALTSDQYTSSRIIAGPMPWVDAAALWSLSAISTVGAVKTPTMLIVGEEDRRTPSGEALQLYHALKLRDVPTALVLVPEASHSSLGARPSQLNAMVRLTLDWFANRRL
jgi:dipeptidyl aminopeptidase/acylaminoacyl peptidase